MSDIGVGADPAIADRLAEAMDSLANLVDAADVATFVAYDRPLASAERLLQSVETMLYAACQERQRRASD